MRSLSSVCLFVLVLLFAGALIAQQPCSLAPLLGSPAATHIFSPEQELALGDVEAEWKTNASAGNLLTDSFAGTTSDKKRLHEIQKTLRRLPQPCREIVPAPSAEFLAWQAAAMSYPELARR
jgi:hypothetical protein